MFTINKIQRTDFNEVWILKDESSQTCAAILPACGAILHSFVVDNHGERTNVIDSYDREEDFRRLVTSLGFKGCKLSPFVCRIKNGEYSFDGKDYKIKKYYDGQNALHGVLYDQSFSVIRQEATETKAIISMICSYRGSDPGYPFSYDCIITYELLKDNQLNVITMIVNKDDSVIPVQDGWHPYFRLWDKIDNLQLEFQSANMLEFDEELIPTGKLIKYDKFNSLKTFGKTVFDNCFALNFESGKPICVLRNKEKKIEIQIHPDISYPYLQFYTPAHRKSIAIENISGAPDGFNNGLGVKTVSPGESVVFSTTYKISLLK